MGTAYSEFRCSWSTRRVLNTYVTPIAITLQALVRFRYKHTKCKSCCVTSVITDKQLQSTSEVPNSWLHYYFNQTLIRTFLSETAACNLLSASARHTNGVGSFAADVFVPRFKIGPFATDAFLLAAKWTWCSPEYFVFNFFIALHIVDVANYTFRKTIFWDKFEIFDGVDDSSTA